MSVRRVLTAATAGVLVAGVAGVTPAYAYEDWAVVGDGVVDLGVNAAGHLVVPNDESGNRVGLRYTPDGLGDASEPAEGIGRGAEPCESWGVADETSGLNGFASSCHGISPNVRTEPLAKVHGTEAYAVSATSIATVDERLRVTHENRPSRNPTLVQGAVTIQNLSDAPVVPRYRRAIDWAVTPQGELITIQGTAADPAVVFASNDGRAHPNPLSGPGSGSVSGDVVDAESGEQDQGSVIDFRFDTLPPGASRTFYLYFGATPSELDADIAVKQVSATGHVYAQTPAASQGLTYVLAFGGDGVPPRMPTLTAEERTLSENEPALRGTLRLDAAVTWPVSVEYAPGGGTATEGRDYRDARGTAYFPPGSTTAEVAIPLIDDDRPEPTETLRMHLDSVRGAYVDHRSPLNFYILDDDGGPDGDRAPDLSRTREMEPARPNISHDRVRPNPGRPEYTQVSPDRPAPEHPKADAHTPGAHPVQGTRGGGIPID